MNTMNSLSGAGNRIERTYWVDFVRTVPSQLMERIQKLRQSALPSDISLSLWLKDAAYVNGGGFPVVAG